jgi:hypothetical protein
MDVLCKSMLVPDVEGIHTDNGGRIEGRCYPKAVDMLLKNPFAAKKKKKKGKKKKR